MSFTVMSWNVRQFRGASAHRTRDVAEMIRDQDPDVFAIIEFRAKDVARDLISEEFTDYDFAMTDSKRQLDFLVGWPDPTVGGTTSGFDYPNVLHEVTAGVRPWVM